MKKQTKAEQFKDSVLGGLSKKADYQNQQAKQTTGLPLSPVRQRSPDTLRENPDNDFADLQPKEFERLKNDIQSRGVLVPLIAKADGTLLSGHNRLRAARELNLSAVPVQFVEIELSKKAEREHLVKDNLLRRQLTPEQQIFFLAELYPGYMELDTVSSSGGSLGGLKAQIADETGLTPKQIQRFRQTYQQARELARQDGRKQPNAADIKKAKAEQNRERKAAARIASKASESLFPGRKTAGQGSGSPEDENAGKRLSGRLDRDTARAEVFALVNRLSDGLNQAGREQLAVIFQQAARSLTK